MRDGRQVADWRLLLVAGRIDIVGKIHTADDGVQTSELSSARTHTQKESVNKKRIVGLILSALTGR